ncbi:hypothetical protein Pmani_011598 [Petrolisthes manimaculis]|uniref:C-type lectin domain-containing protein n=1 Tax=Petrolisthes manimaculis TaxID=1843537 RepID=A0AAE1PZC3_9EUCA|nr:hypothetical protein Pmani_011598 [Petrolisthes manimaculis]
MGASVQVLVLLLVLHQALYINAESQNWYKVEVSNAILDGETPRGERSVRSEVQCTMVASRDPQNQLLCFRTPGVCTTYDIVVMANDSDSFNGGDDVTLSDEIVLNDDCSITIINQESSEIYEGNSDDPIPYIDFSTLVDKNCIHLEKTLMNFEDSRNFCNDLPGGGDLFVAGDMMGMIQYLAIHTPGKHVIVGATNNEGHNRWLDGRSITLQELEPGKTIGENECFYVKDNEMMHTHDCDRAEYFLCQKGVEFS